MDNEVIGLDNEAIETQSAAAVPKGYRGPKAFRALRHRNYRLFFFGQLVSIIGTWMQTTALPLLIIQLVPQKQQGIWLGIYGFLPLLPLIPLALIAGSLADRFSKRKILVLTQTTMMLQAFVLAALTAAGTIQMWQILLLAFVSGAAAAIDLPARQAFVVEMVGDQEDLGSAIALNSAIFNLGRAFGPVLAGLLIASLGFSAAFAVNGLSFLAVIAGLLIAVLADRSKFERTAKSLIFMPMAISFVGASVIWNFIYEVNPPGTPQIGLLNAIVVALGGQSHGWTNYVAIAPWNNLFLVIIVVWLQAGYAMVLFSAAIKGIPSSK